MSATTTIPDQPVVNRQDTTAPDAWFKRLKELEKSQSCPSYGHCPTCGRGNYYPNSWPYHPVYPGYPQVWCSNNTAGAHG